MTEAPRGEVENAIHPAWVWGAACVLLVALLARQGVLVLAAALLLCAVGVSYLWGRHALDRVSYRRAFAQRRVRWGEDVAIEIVIENGKFLPLPWLRVEDEAPVLLRWSTPLGATFTRERGLLRHLLAVLWYQRVRRRYTLRGTARGEHVFGPVELRAGDIFGLSVVSRVLPARDTLVVYPKVVPLTALGLPAVQPFGDLTSRQRLYEDPTRTIGIRDYAVGDSSRHMHWKATARAGAPRVRIFEPVRTLRAALFRARLGRDGYDRHGPRGLQGVEPESRRRASSARSDSNSARACAACSSAARRACISSVSRPCVSFSRPCVVVNRSRVA